jgi:hypothetical protein
MGPRHAAFAAITPVETCRPLEDEHWVVRATD